MFVSDGRANRIIALYLYPIEENMNMFLANIKRVGVGGRIRLPLRRIGSEESARCVFVNTKLKSRVYQ